jgi:hypothetical protein
MESHEEEARRLLAAELRLIGPEVMNVGGMDRVADSVINGTHRFVVIRAANMQRHELQRLVSKWLRA